MGIAFCIVCVGFALTFVWGRMHQEDAKYYKQQCDKWYKAYCEMEREYEGYIAEVVDNLEKDGDRQETNI